MGLKDGFSNDFDYGQAPFHFSKRKMFAVVIVAMLLQSLAGFLWVNHLRARVEALEPLQGYFHDLRIKLYRLEGRINFLQSRSVNHAE